MSKNKGGWVKFVETDTLFESNVREIIIKHVEPFMESLGIESDEELIVAGLALLTTSIRLMYQLDLEKPQVEKKLLNTLELVWTVSDLIDSFPADGNIH